jgi:hypothetical protein
MADMSQARLRRIRLNLARTPRFPNGSNEHGYEFVAPLDDAGQIDATAWEAQRDACRVRRFWADEEDEFGHLVRHAENWVFTYDIDGDEDQDETIFRLEGHSFRPGEYVTIREQDGELATFQVISVQER